MEYFVLNTEIGWIAILGSERGLVRVTLPQKSDREALSLLSEMANNVAVPAPNRFRDLAKRLKTYFSGHKSSFPDELDLSAGTPFQRDVWRTTRLIPYGETRSYSWLAEKIGNHRATRAIGQSLGRNPLPIIIPCHRVIGSDGKLGGYAGGIEIKRQLLSSETKTTSHQW